MSEIKIEKNIPLPDNLRVYGVIADTFRNMRAGDSCVVDSADADAFQAAAKRQGGKVTYRKVSATKIRVWRTK